MATAKSDFDHSAFIADKPSGFDHSYFTPDESFLDKAGNAAQTYINDPIEALTNPIRDFSTGAVQGISNIAPGIANLGIHAYNGATNSDIKPFKAFDFAPKNLSSLGGQIASYFTPMGAEKLAIEVPEISNLASKANQAVQSLLEHPSVAPKLAATNKAIQETPLVKQVYNGLTSKYAQGIGKNALQGAIFSPDDQGMGAALGAGFGAAVPPLLATGKAILHPYDALAKIFRGNLSAEQLQANMQAAKGTETGLGKAIASPTLNRIHENILPHVIGSGTEDAMQRTASKITEKGNQILENMGGKNDNANYGIELQNALRKASSDARAEKNANYKEVEDLANKEKLKVGRSNLQAAAQDALQEVNGSAELNHEFPSDLRSDLKRYSANQKERLGSNALMQQDDQSLKSSNIFKGILREKAQDFYEKGQMNNYRIVKNLQNALDKDIYEAIHGSTTPELLQSYEKAQADYATKFAPFEDKDIVKFTRQGGDPDLILSHFLRGGKNDRATLLSKLTKSLSSQSAHLPLHAYLSKAVEDGEINAVKMATLYRNLGKNQKNALIKDKGVKKQLDSFTDLVGMNKEAFNLMHNPKTGARNTDLLVKIAATATGGLPGFLASTVGTGLLSRAAKNALTSESVRDGIIKAMLRNEPGQIEPMTLNKFKGYQQ